MYLKVLTINGKPHINLMGHNGEIVLSGEVRSSFAGAVKTAKRIVADPPTKVVGVREFFRAMLKRKLTKTRKPKRVAAGKGGKK